MSVVRVEREQVRQLVAAGAQLVDVMPEKEYNEGHLQDAINLPLRSLNRESAGALRPDRPVVVYCADYQ